jgi:hypothetical protein
MTDDEIMLGRVRENCLQWAMQTAAPGEDVMAVLARAQLFEDYLTSGLEGGRWSRNGMPNADDFTLDKGK